jgi:trans-aconitate methyltransferase
MHVQQNARPQGAEVAKQYADYGQTPHGRLRHDLLSRCYSRFVADHGVRWIFDVGGGTGLLIHSLMAEHKELKAVLIDYDDAMLARAGDVLKSDLTEKRAFIHKGTDQDLPRILATYDVRKETILVCSNHAIEYVPDQLSTVRTLIDAVPKGSFFGIMYLNNSHEAFRKLMFKDSIEGVLQQLKSHDLDMVYFGMAKALDAAAMERFLQEKQVTPVSQYGIRCVTDFKPKDFVEKNYTDMLSMEMELGGHPDFLGLARYRLNFYKK